VSDVELVARARQGDAAAFGALVDLHRSAVYRAARAALHSHEDAEDATQDAFVIAYQRLASFRGDASFKTWLLTIAWHQAISRRRGLSRWWARIATPHRDSADHTMGIETAHPDPSPEAAAAGSELMHAIVDEIRALPPKLRDTLLLAQAGELSYDEIAAITKAPVGTIKWRVSEARKKIKARLVERGFSDVG
jgi:RNA polymerase sigma-70 factor (ECF subfamily)